MAKKRQEDSPPAGAPAWMATFSDLMNLLLCFFVLLFSMSTVDAEKMEQVIQSFNNSFSIFSGGTSVLGDEDLVSSGMSQLNELDEYFNNMGTIADDVEEKVLEEIEKRETLYYEKLEQEVSTAISNNAIEEYVETSYTSNYVRLAINGAILYDSGKAIIKQEALPIINKLGEILKRYHDDYMITIEGHTDALPINNGIYKNNLRLSIDRAAVVQEYLIEEIGLNPETLNSLGCGEYQPIVENDTEENRAKNRRIEIKLIKIEKKSE